MRRIDLCIDANEPDRLRPFWRLALGYVERPDTDGTIDLVDPSGTGPNVWFQRVPEPKTTKNRIHIDVYVEPDERDGLTRHLLDLGGTVLREYRHFVVLADPEGNEVCLNDNLCEA